MKNWVRFLAMVLGAAWPSWSVGAGLAAQQPVVLRGPVWTAESNQANAQFGTAVGPAGDVNGDGFSDALVGAYTYSNGQTREGRAYLYLGSAAGLGASPAWTAESDQANALFGYPTTTAGDVNGDGYSDVIIGAYGYSNGQNTEGAAFLYLGSATGLGASPAWMAEGDQVNANYGYSAATAGDVNGDGFSDVLVGALQFSNGQQGEGRAFLYLGSASGLATTPAWTAESDQALAFFGTSVATAGDVNGDGYGDVLVGARNYHNGEEEEGRAYLYLGSGSGLSPSPAWTTESDEDDGYLGYWVATAGDTNGDGFGDVIVGAYGVSNGELLEGRAYAYLGSASGLETSPAWTVEGDLRNAFLGYSVATAGDLNGDGFGDVLVGSYGYESRGRALAYLGSASGLETSPAWTSAGQAESAFSFALATAGDVNGDGYSDVIVGALGFDNGQRNEGRAYVYHGTASGLSRTSGWTADGPGEQGGFGSSVATAGDVDGDGYGDVIVGAHSLSGGEPNDGVAFVYRGSADGLSTTTAWSVGSGQSNSFFGASVGGAGDVNGDGFGDVIVGAHHFANGEHLEGKAFVYQGSESGLATAPAWTAEGDQVNAGFGHSVAGAGDVNGDGYGDVVVGAWQFDGGQTDEGRAFLFLGSSKGLATTPAWTAEGNQASSGFGASVAGAGDVNADGFSDVIVGAPRLDGGEVDEGRAFLYLGSPTGLSASPVWSAESDQAAAFFGSSVAAAGDVNGDGYGDVIVGANGFDNGQASEGRAHVYLGSDKGPATIPAWTAEGERVNAFFGVVSTAGDANGDGYSDVIVGAHGFTNGQASEGRALVYLGSAAGLATSPAWTAEGNQATAQFGAALAAAGDVNGDGYGDVLVGAHSFTSVESNDGRAFLYLGNDGRGGRVHTLQQRRKTDQRPIALLGRTGVDGLFRIQARFPRDLSVFAWATAATPRAYLEWEVKPLGVPFDGKSIERSNRAVPLEPVGGMVTFNELASLGSPPGRQRGGSFHWRARIATTNPLFPNTAWFSQPGNNVTEAKLRRTRLPPD